MEPQSKKRGEIILNLHLTQMKLQAEQNIILIKLCYCATDSFFCAESKAEIQKL